MALICSISVLNAAGIKVYGADESVEYQQQVDDRHKATYTKENNILIGKSQQEIKNILKGKNAFICGKNDPRIDSAIEDPVSYLRKNVGKKTDSYKVVSSKVLSGVGSVKCTSLGGNNNCTLTALYNIMKYYRLRGYKKIPSDNTQLYSVIKKSATNVGYTKKKGLPVTKNNNFVKQTWQKGFGYKSGSGNNNYMWSYSTLKKQIDGGNPCMFSIANGYYYNHTVAVVGYKEYKNLRTGKKYTFLVVYDGWSTKTRYIAMENTGALYFACQTSIIVPKNKK